ncbi:hypothetical protein CR513_08138, partial [Mucuna pruriens]
MASISQRLDHERIDQIFGRFQTIINNLKSLGKTYDNYDHWRPQVTTLIASKDLKKFTMDELLGTLNVHKLELNDDGGERKVVCYERKKPKHFKSKSPNLEKEKEKKKKKPFFKKIKGLMATWEDLNLSSFEEKDEEENIYLMANTNLEEDDDHDENNLYKINLTNLTNQNTTCPMSINSDQWTWHKKIRYATLRLLSKLKKHNLVRGSFEKGKQVTRSFELRNIVLTSRPLELLHNDLFGLTKTAFMNGKRYELVVVNDYSRWT